VKRELPGLLGHQPLVDAINAGMEKTANKRQAIPVIHAAGIQPPVNLEHVGGAWSPGQHARRSA
jgi:hypothetical protein